LFRKTTININAPSMPVPVITAANQMFVRVRYPYSCHTFVSPDVNSSMEYFPLRQEQLQRGREQTVISSLNAGYTLAVLTVTETTCPFKPVC
jgi:hypothetical protein